MDHVAGRRTMRKRSANMNRIAKVTDCDGGPGKFAPRRRLTTSERYGYEHADDTPMRWGSTMPLAENRKVSFLGNGAELIHMGGIAEYGISKMNRPRLHLIDISNRDRMRPEKGTFVGTRKCTSMSAPTHREKPELFSLDRATVSYSRADWAAIYILPIRDQDRRRQAGRCCIQKSDGAAIRR